MKETQRCKYKPPQTSTIRNRDREVPPSFSRARGPATTHVPTAVVLKAKQTQAPCRHHSRLPVAQRQAHTYYMNASWAHDPTRPDSTKTINRLRPEGRPSAHSSRQSLTPEPPGGTRRCRPFPFAARTGPPPTPPWTRPPGWAGLRARPLPGMHEYMHAVS